MKGLLIKDLYVLKQQIKIYSIVFLLWMVIAVFQKSWISFVSMSSIFIMFIPLVTCSYDERSGWNSFALTTPVKRSDIVLSKYILSLIILIGVGIISFILSICLESFSIMNLMVIGIFMSLSLILVSVILPITFKVGSEKSRIITMLLFLIIFALVMLIFKTGVASSNDEAFGMSAIIQFIREGVKYLPLAAVIIMIISITSSIKILKNKEF